MQAADKRSLKLTDSVITIALAKGRLADEALAILSKCGIDTAPLFEPTRKLVLFDGSKQYRFIFVKPSDVPTYVCRGVADIGVAGKDTLLEADADVYEMVDLGFGKCRLCIAGYESKKDYVTRPSLRVATKYTNIAQKYYNSIGVRVDIIKLNGSVELAPIIDLSDVILDIVESGKTLEANGLIVLQELFDISARLIVNKVSLKTKAETVIPLIDKIKKQAGERG